MPAFSVHYALSDPCILCVVLYSVSYFKTLQLIHLATQTILCSTLTVVVEFLNLFSACSTGEYCTAPPESEKRVHLVGENIYF